MEIISSDVSPPQRSRLLTWCGSRFSLWPENPSLAMAQHHREPISYHGAGSMLKDEADLGSPSCNVSCGTLSSQQASFAKDDTDHSNQHCKGIHLAHCSWQNSPCKPQHSKASVDGVCCGGRHKPRIARIAVTTSEDTNPVRLCRTASSRAWAAINHWA